MKKIILTLFLCTLFYRHIMAQDISSLFQLSGFIRTNLIGFPVIHEKKAWVFDPDVAKKRRPLYIELHGDKGEKLIEKLGLGVDGRHEDRLKMQRERDDGHLGGLNAFLP